MFTEKNAVDALIKLSGIKGVQRAKLIEKMLRLETNHFKSKQYQLSGSAGMEDGSWQNLIPGSYTTFKMNDNHLQGALKERTFIKWNSVYDFCLYLSDYIDRHNGNYARWNSTDLNRQAEYMSRVNAIKNRIV